MHILITGGAGFLGQRLAQRLLEKPDLQSLTLADVALPSALTHHPKVNVIQADLTDLQAAQSLVSEQLTAVYHLAAVVSGQAEANFDLGMAVNVDGTRHLLEAVRHQAPGAQFIFASSLAVFGGDLPNIINESTVVTPQSSYGTQKAICELLVNDYTRKGYIDGRVLRLPTVCVRPGKPNAAASSFVSSIIREPLQGQMAVCPVEESLPIWLASPGTTVANLAHALTLQPEQFAASQWGHSRTINLPGLTVTIKDMIQALAQVANAAVTDQIQRQPDEKISAIVASWPSRFDVSLARSFGFAQDENFEEIIRAFVREELSEQP
ncbi:MAG: D-erythronate dehydrogenase [Phormidesmis sp.]